MLSCLVYIVKKVTLFFVTKFGFPYASVLLKHKFVVKVSFSLCENKLRWQKERQETG